MQKTHLLVAALFMLAAASCSERPDVSQAASKQSGIFTNCQGYDGTKADPCRVSLHALIAQPAHYNGLYVEVAGMYVEGLDRVLFSDRDSAENSILKNGIFVAVDDADAPSELVKHRNKFVTIAGIFSSIERDRSEFAPRDFSQFSGRIQVDKLGSATSAPIPYACWDPERNRALDPRTVKALLGEKACDDPSEE